MKPEDIEELRQLIEFLKAHQVAEFDLDRGDVKIRLKFQQEAHASPGLADLARVLASAPAAVGQATSATKAAALASPASAAAEDPDA
jgi:acetyl-CoA carboxylase biotin carboxyl carrier protein